MDELIQDMDRLGQTTGEFAERVLFAGAEEIKKAWRKAARLHGLIDTGEMFDSIGYANKPYRARDILSIDIYPQGYSVSTTNAAGEKVKRKIKVRNAEKAFVLHYGTSRFPATHWVDTADDLSGPAVESTCRELLEQWLKQNGFL
jgi:hypothetical protein